MSQKIKCLNEENVRLLCSFINKAFSKDEIIDDINIKSDGVFSSYYTTKLLQQLKTYNENYTNTVFGELTHLRCEETNILPTLDNTEVNTLYLYSATSTAPYQQYLKISDGTTEKLIDLGSTSITLSEYMKAIDIANTYTTKIETQAIIDMVGNASDLETTAKDTLVSAINEIKEGLDDCITKENIATTLDSTVTDTQVPSALGTKTYVDTTVDGKANTTDLTTHTRDTDIHITSAERTKWNNKANASDIPTKVSELENDSNFVGLNDTQASATTTYSSNKIADLIAEATTGKQMITINNMSGKEVKYFKIANTLVNNRGYMVSMVGLRVNTTASNEIFSLNRYNNSYKYTYDRILTARYSSSDVKVEAFESCYLVLGDDYALYAVVGSYCLATIEFIGMSNTLIKEEVDSLPTAKFTSYEQQDVGVVTTITPVNGNITGTIEYTVKNGICYVSMKNLVSKVSSSSLSISTTMPKPSINVNTVSISPSGDMTNIYINKDTTNLIGDFYQKNVPSSCLFSYPVAE